MPSFNRRNFLSAGAGAAVVVAAPSIALAQEGPIRVGAVLPQQGPFALYGEGAALGAKAALQMVSGKAKGRPVELIVYDDPNPLGAQQSMRKMILQDKVCAVMGGMTSASGLALASVGAQEKIPTIITQATVRDITGKNCDRYVFRTNAFTSVYSSVLSKHLVPMGKKWYFLVGDYAYGQEVHQLMKAEVQAAGGSDVGMDATPVGTTDFSSYILKIRQAKPDVVILGIAGLDLAAFLKQYQEFGMRTPLAAVALGDEDLWALQAHPKMLMGKNWHFNDPANTPEEQALNTFVMKASGHPATVSSALGWMSMRLMLAGIEGSKSLAPLDIVRGIEAARPSGVRGYYRVWDHQLIWQPLIGQLRDTISNKHDPLIVVSKPVSVAEVEGMYGSQQDSACKMTSS